MADQGETEDGRESASLARLDIISYTRERVVGDRRG